MSKECPVMNITYAVFYSPESGKCLRVKPAILCSADEVSLSHSHMSLVPLGKGSGSEHLESIVLASIRNQVQDCSEEKICIVRVSAFQHP